MAKLTATEFGKLTTQAAYSAYDDAFAGLTEARSAQGSAIAASEALDAEKVKLIADHADALKAKDQERQDALDKLAAGHATELAQQQAAADAALVQAKADMDAAIKQAQAAADKALTDATAPLQARIADLVAQIAGSPGSYQIAVTPVQHAALVIETGSDEAIAEWVAINVGALLTDVAKKHQEAILQIALQKYPSLSSVNQAAILTALGLSWLASAPLKDQVSALAALGLQRYLTLPSEVQTGVITQLGL